MEPTISLIHLIYIYLFLLILFFLTPSKRKFIISFVFRSKMPTKKEKIVVGKVIVAKAVGIFFLYIGKIRLIINRPGKGKRITERKEIN